MENANPLVSVLILNWNGASFLGECLTSVLATSYAPIEVVVVDNLSHDNSVSIVKQFPSVRLIENDQNYGFAEGNNIGMRHCRGSHVVILNNDMTVEPDWLDKPVSLLEGDPRIGAVGCRQMSYYQKTVIDGLYHVVKPDLTFIPFGAGRKMSESEEYIRSRFVLSVNGGAMVLRKTMFTDAGGFDSRFFAYLDEIDLFMKAFMKGWKTFYCAESVVYHKGSASFKKTGAFQYYLRERNRIWFLYKYFSLSVLLLHLPFLVVMELRVIRVLCLKLRSVKTYIACRKDALASLGYYRGERRENLLKLQGLREQFRLFLQNRSVD